MISLKMLYLCFDSCSRH